jgi:hypothetical protein
MIKNLSPNFDLIFMCASSKKFPKIDQILPKEIQFKAKSNPSKNIYKPDDLVPLAIQESIKKGLNNDITSLDKMTWRNLIELNSIQNFLNLRPAYDLYDKNYNRMDVYTALFKAFQDKFYILSAGWGLINAEFKIPSYDITFSQGQNIDPQIIRLEGDHYNDFNELSKKESNEDIVFIGSPSYLPSFYKLTKSLSNRRKIIFWKKSGTPSEFPAPDKTYEFIKYQSNNNIAWHYELVTNQFLNASK